MNSEEIFHIYIMRHKILGLPRCKNLTRFSLFVSFCFAVRYCLKCFCFLCFTSSVSFTGSYTEVKPKFLCRQTQDVHLRTRLYNSQNSSLQFVSAVLSSRKTLISFCRLVYAVAISLYHSNVANLSLN